MATGLHPLGSKTHTILSQPTDQVKYIHQHNLNDLTPGGDKNSSQDQYVTDLRNLGIEPVQESTATNYINWKPTSRGDGRIN